MPYLFDEKTGGLPLGQFPPAQTLRAYQAEPPKSLSHLEYFCLCLSAHYLTCGTPVPTDVDNQIRQKLWPKALPLDVARSMAELVLVSRHWDFSLVTTRHIQRLSGHLGEWFTVATGAYCALRKYKEPAAKELAETIFQQILDELTQHSETFGALWLARDGLGCLKAASCIAHNLGDLDRVMDMWELAADDPLRVSSYKLSSLPHDSAGKLRHHGRLFMAGELYKAPLDGASSLALENHRHYALRKPRCLRQSPAFLLPTGPFYDSWGAQVAEGLSKEDRAEVLETLMRAWERQPGSLGYGRGLRGMLERHADLKITDLTRVSERSECLALAKGEFEKKWAEAALKQIATLYARLPVTSRRLGS